MSNLPSWAQMSIVVTAVLLSPVLAFLTAMAVEILIGVLADAGLTACIAFLAAGVIGYPLLRKLRVRPRSTAQDWG
jgi:hypothetical protein